MSAWLKRLHGRREAPGVETTLLKRMPAILVLGSLVPVAVAGLARLWLNGSAGAAKQVASIDIFLIAALVTFWTAALTVSIACFIIFVMKGPGFVADANPLNEAPRPRRQAYRS